MVFFHFQVNCDEMKKWSQLKWKGFPFRFLLLFFSLEFFVPKLCPRQKKLWVALIVIRCWSPNYTSRILSPRHRIFFYLLGKFQSQNCINCVYVFVLRSLTFNNKYDLPAPFLPINLNKYMWLFVIVYDSPINEE